MTVRPEDPWRNPPRIGLAAFEAILKGGNPGILSERTAASYWNYCVNKGVDPLYIISQFNHESNLGTAGVATQTHSWGNTRTPNFGAKAIGTVHGASGTFPVWRDWLDGMISTVERYLAPDWVYHYRVPIREIFIWPPDPNLVWAPAGDLNDPHGYLRAVIDFMNAHEESLFMAEIPGFTFVPETCGEFGYPKGTHGRNQQPLDRLIIHYTDGVDSLPYLTGCHENSVHFLTERDGTPRAQMIVMADAAWGCGNREYNLRSINLEIERLKAQANDWPDDLIDNVARIAADICKACPSILPDRQHIIGHGDVPNQDHTDPGPFFPWPHFIDRVNFYMTGPSPIPPQPNDPWIIPDNPFGPYGFILGFKAWAQAVAGARSPDLNAGILSVLGYPMHDEYLGTDGNTYQVCERGTLQYTPGNSVPFDIVILPCREVLPDKAAV